MKLFNVSLIYLNIFWVNNKVFFARFVLSLVVARKTLGEHHDEMKK